MTAKMIVILMVLVLIALFVWSRSFRRKEESITALERESFLALDQWSKNKDEANKEKAIAASVALFCAHGLSQEQALKKAQENLGSLSHDV